MTKLYKYTRRKRWEQWYDFVLIPIIAFAAAAATLYIIIGLWTGEIH